MLAWVLVIIVSVTPLLCATAYVIGRHASQGVTIPWRPIFQLVDHRQRCLGQGRERIRAELGGLLPVAPWAWDELFALRVPLSPLRGRR